MNRIAMAAITSILVLLSSIVHAQDGSQYAIIGYVTRKVEGGLIVKAPQWGEIAGFQQCYDNARAAGIKHPENQLYVFLKGDPDQERLADGDRVCVIAYEIGVYSNGGSTYHAYAYSN